MLYKTQAVGCTVYGDMGQNKTWLQKSFNVPNTAKTVYGIHNKEVSAVLKEMSTVLMLLCIKSTQIELKCSIHKTLSSHYTDTSLR